ncbi:MAG TPA: serine/threonine-protein kinase [Labilithrix sp.]|nr:serine/threonine-protein kinase [Labilithrix sp.]
MKRPADPPAPRQYDENAPTHLDSVGPGTGPTAGGGGDSTRGSASSLVTARETLVFQEIQRTRAFMRVAIALAVAQAWALPFVGGDRTAKIALVVALVVVVAICGRLLLLLRDDEGYSMGRALAAAYATIFAVFAGIHFYGVFSPGAAIVPLGIYFFCTGQSDRASVAVYATCAAAYAALGGLVVFGVMPDRGIVTAHGVPLLERVVILILIEGIFYAVYVIARKTRAATLFAIERHDVVVRSLAQRDALLHEARHDLVQAMRVGGVGRFSGEVVGPFRLGSVIGRGAMGEVYEALRMDTQEEVAIKLVHPQLLVEHEVVERFLREAKVTSALSAANVVRVVETSGPDAPIPFLAMERLHGEDLATHLRDNKRMAGKQVVAMMKQIAVGLDAAHAAGIVHRDLKPRNIFCARPKGAARASAKDVWKILDFGVSKLDSGDGTLTGGQLVGTPAYMAPEQARALPVGRRADIFALGVIAYRALTGSPPFSGDSNVEILFRVSHSMPLRPSHIAKLPEALDLVLAIALAKEPEDRFAAATELAAALDAALRGKIDPRLGAHARAVLAALPWGASHGPRG